MGKKQILLSIVFSAAALSAAVVKKPLIRPQWSGAEPGVWTMDYGAALESAKADGKWTIMYYSGMWWCPHCQPLEEKVLVTQSWQDYVDENGFYLTVLDFPNRAGTGYWCWLWDADYRADAGLTPEAATEALIERFETQGEYALADAQVTTNANVVVTVEDGGATTNMVPYAAEPQTVYRRIGYPTFLVINPKGRVIGRFSASVDTQTPEAAFTRITNLVEQAKMGGSVTVGVAPGEEDRGTATSFDGVLKYGETLALTATAKKGYAFAGWLDGVDASPDTRLDYRQAKNTLEASGADADLRAHFVTAAEDFLWFDASIDLSYFIPGEEVSIPLAIDSGTFPTVKVTGLPAGLSFDAKTLRVTGAAKTPGLSYITVTAQNAWGYKFSQVVEALVDRFEGRRFYAYDQECEVGESFAAEVSGMIKVYDGGAALSSLKLTGLPKGIVQSADGKTVSGKPTKAGSYAVTCEATFSDGVRDAAAFFFDVYEPESPAEDYVSLDCLEFLTVGEALTRDDLEFGTFEDGVGVTAVSGLPTGLKSVTWTDETGVKCVGAEGTPSKAGKFTVTATVKRKSAGKIVTEKVSRTVIVEDAVYQYIGGEVLDPTNCPGCTVSGGGVTAPCKSAKLTAKAASKYVFAGWYVQKDEPVANDGVVDYREKTRTVAWEEDVQSIWHARFVTKDEDVEHGVTIDGLDDLEFALDAAEPFDEVFTVDSLSLPKLTVKGLPDGVTCDTVSDEKGEYHLSFYPEIAKKTPLPGRYTVTVTAENQSKAKETAVFKIAVANWTDEAVHVPDDYGDYKPGVELSVGAEVNPVIFLTNAVDFARGDTLKVSGLPKGLAYNEKANAGKGVFARTITGKPTVPGDYTITFTATVLGKTHKATSSLTVEEFPALTVALDDEAEAAGNKVTGQKSKTYIAGSKVSLKAVAAKGWVFAGWEGDVAVTGLEALNPTLSHVTGPEPATIEAKFVRLSEDRLYVSALDELIGTNTLLVALNADLSKLPCGDLVERAVLTNSVSLPSVTVSGLPKGAKFTAKTLALSGKVTKPGHSYVTVSAKNAGGYSYVRVWHFCVLNADGTAPEEPADVNTAGADTLGFDWLVTGLCYGEGDVGIYVPAQESTRSSVTSVKLTGLPAGLVAKTELYEEGDAEVLCTGTPTKPGRFTLTATVTYANRKTSKAVVSGIVEDGGSAYLEVVSADDARGSVTAGSGVYASGQTVKLTAKAKSKCVFGGWYYAPAEGDEFGWMFDLLGEYDGIDWRTASVSFPFRPREMSGLKLVADFAPAADDTVMAVVPEDEIWEIDTETDSTFGLGLLSYSLPKLTVKGLPSGITWDAGLEEFACDSDQASKMKPGVYEVSVTAVNQSKKSDSASFLLVVPNLESDYIDGLDPDPFAYSFSTGAAFDPKAIVPVVEDEWKLSVSGLPSGLAWKNGAITGVPTKAGYFTVTFTATKGSGSSKRTEKATIVICIEKLPRNATGNFTGVLYEDICDEQTNVVATAVAGTLSVSVTSAGKISATVVRPTGTEKFSASSWASLDLDACVASAVLKKGSSTLALNLDFSGAWSNVVLSAGYESGEGAVRHGCVLRNSFADDAEAAEALEPLVGTCGFKVVAAAEAGAWDLVEVDSDAALTMTVKANGSAIFAGKVGGYKISGSSQVSFEDGAFVVRQVTMVGKDSTLTVAIGLGEAGEAVSGEAVLVETEVR